MKMSSLCTLRKRIALLAFLVMIAANVLAIVLPLGGRTPGEVSEMYPNLFAPAGLTFSIWGLIYLLLGLNLAYQLCAQKVKEDLLCALNLPFALSSIANTAWIFCWHNLLIPVTVLLTLSMLACLIWIMKLVTKVNLKPSENFFIKLPFAVYLGWLTVATIANITVLLVYSGWDGFGLAPEVWTVIILVVGTAIGILTGIRFDSVAYLLVLIWAYVGILIKHISKDGFNGQYPAVTVTACLCIAMFLLTIVLMTVKKRRGRIAA